MKVKAGLVQQEDRTLMGFRRLNKKNEVERKEPLESVAAFLEGYGEFIVLI